MKSIPLKKLFNQSLLTLSLLSYPLLGDLDLDPELLNRIEECDRVESRKIPHALRVQIQEALLNEEREQKNTELGGDPIPKATLNYHLVNKSIAFLDYKGSLIETKDGMLMTVNGGDAHIADQWQLQDQIYLMPNSFLFSSAYLFKAYNSRTKQSVKVELHRRPIYNPAPTIKLIDYDNGKVGLSDGTTWNICYFDKKTINMWDPGDEVIIGINNHWNKFAKPYILINLEVLAYARAQSLK